MILRWSEEPKSDGKHSKEPCSPSDDSRKRKSLKKQKQLSTNSAALEDALHCRDSFASLCLGRSANVS